MSTSNPWGRVIEGDPARLEAAHEQWRRQPVDREVENGSPPAENTRATTIRRPVTVTGPGTFLGKATRTLTLEPLDRGGWWFDRGDLPEHLPTLASVRNVWTTRDIVSNIVLRSGSPHNYVRMVEHLVALRLGLGIDNLNLRLDSGDPPLFERGSLDLVDAIDSAGLQELDCPARYLTVRETVAAVAPHGGFVILAPCRGKRPQLHIDCAVDFPNAIGSQRVRFPLTADIFRSGAVARTNTTAARKLYCQTIGRLFADVRNLGYTDRNVLIAGKRRYINEPRLVHGAKSLEAVWHRACLDLLAALSLIEGGRFAGEVISYKAGHTLDVRLVTRLYQEELLVPFEPPAGW